MAGWGGRWRIRPLLVSVSAICREKLKIIGFFPLRSYFQRPPHSAKSPSHSKRENRFAVLHENGHAISGGGASCFLGPRAVHAFSLRGGRGVGRCTFAIAPNGSTEKMSSENSGFPGTSRAATKQKSGPTPPTPLANLGHNSAVLLLTIEGCWSMGGEWGRMGQTRATA